MKNEKQQIQKTDRLASLLEIFKARRVKQSLPVQKNNRILASVLLYDYISKLLGVWVIRPASMEEPRFLINGFFAKPLYKRYVTYEKSEMGQAIGMVCWFPIRTGFRSFEISDGEGKIPFLCNKKPTISVRPQDIRPPQSRKKQRTFKNKLALLLAGSWPVRKRYGRCWLFADRDFKADDNAEHLYRWLRTHHPEQKAFFALSRQSEDWGRLKQEGFQLVDMASIRYFFAFVNSEWLIASNITDFIYKSSWRKKFGDVLRQHVCYLQHGITHNYQPSMNKKTYRLLITATEREYHAFAHDPAYDYTLSSREVRLTGFPRHDALVRKAKKVPSPRTILLMPTWREAIVNDLDHGSGKRPYYPYFTVTDFFLNWNAVLTSDRLRATAAAHGYRLRFFPHPYIRQQLRDFELDEGVLVNDVGSSIQDILAETALLITDYSSVSMEIAMLRRPVLYFQFDREEFLAGGHWVRHGYFDYHKDGFGEVLEDSASLIDSACDCIEAGCGMRDEYVRRSRNFFTFGDQKNCRRVYEAIKGVIRVS